MKPVLSVVALLALALATACPSAGGNPSWRGRGGAAGGPGDGPAVAATPREFTPSGEPAARYNDGQPPAAASSPVADAILAEVDAVARASGGAPPVRDGRLGAVAQDLADFLQGQQLPPYAAVEFALAHHGLLEPSPELMLAEGDERAPGELAAAVRVKLEQTMTRGRWARAGVGVARQPGGGVRIVLALQVSGLDTEPVARAAVRGGRIAVRGALREPYGDPTVYVTAPDGKVDKLPLVRDGGRGFRAEVACRAEGRQQIEIIGRGPEGVTVLANFPVWCGVEPPRSLALAPPRQDRYETGEEAARIIFADLNADRAAHGLPPLAWDDRAAGIARAHSEDMRDHAFVAHVSPRTGNAGDRAKAGGLATPVVLENVARAYSPAEAEQGFMNSPGHRANVLSREATHVGIGVALGKQLGEGRRELYVTQLFFRVPPRLSRAEARAATEGALAAARGAAGGGALARDGSLDGVAQAYAEGLARGDDQKALAREADARTDSLATRYRSIVTVVVVTGDPSQPGLDEVVADPALSAFGLGLAQGPHPEMGKDAWYVVLLLAKPR